MKPATASVMGCMAALIDASMPFAEAGWLINEANITSILSF